MSISTLELAKVCKAAYAGPIRTTIYKAGDMPLIGQKIVHGSHGRGFCRIFWNDEYVIVAFRGSRESVDWGQTNFKFIRVKLKNVGIHRKVVRVHRGFQETLYQVDKTPDVVALESIFSHLKTESLLDKKIVITGHSLGAAIATLFSVKLRYWLQKNNGKKIHKIVTFGSPAVGGKRFCRFYGDLHRCTERVVNGSDGAPFLPPIGFSHVGEEIWLNGNKATRNIGWRDRLKAVLKAGQLGKVGHDHSRKEYIEVLANLEQDLN